MADADLVYDVPGFCRAAKISKATLYELWSRGDGPPRAKFGRAVRIPKDGARRWLEKRSRAAS